MLSRTVFIIGVDGASFNVLEPHLRAGRMPELRRFLEASAYTDLRSVCPPVSPAAWASFHTGKEPRKHGIFGFVGYDPQTASLRFNAADCIRGPTFWQLLSAAGYRVGVVNVPMTFPPPRLNGVVVSGFETPSAAADFCWPPELRARILEVIPGYLFGPEQVAPDRAEFLPELIKAGMCEFRQRVALVELLHDLQEFDVFMVNLQSLDWLLHRLYLYAVEGFGARARPDLLQATRRLMQVLDGALGRLLQVARDYRLRLLLSDHGFTREIGRIYANVALAEWGYYRPQQPKGPGNRGSIARRVYRRMLNSDRRLLRSIAWAARGWRRSPRYRWVTDQQNTASLRVGFDVRCTKAAVLASELYGLVYLNRHPSGPLHGASGPDLAAERAQLAGRFRSLDNPLTGRALFERVIVRDSDQRPDHWPAGPDLVLVPPTGLRVMPGLAPRDGSCSPVLCTGLADARGTHAPDGIFAAAGEVVRQVGRVQPLRLVDVAPTILSLMRVPVPADTDGAVIPAVRTSAGSVGPASAAPAAAVEQRRAGVALTARDERLVAERLRSLGYLE